MSIPSYGEFPSQQSSGKEHPSKGVPQFKAPLRFQPGVQSGTLLEQDQAYSASGASPFNGAPFFQVTNPSQPVAQQPEKWIEQRRYYAPSGMHPSNTAFQHSGPTMSSPSVMAPSSVVARDTYFAGNPITQKSNVLTDLSWTPYM
jgi:hypothetical protein